MNDDFNGLKNLNNPKHSNYDNVTLGSYNNGREDVVSTGTWIVIMIIMVIPFINIIAMFIMAFTDMNTNIKNFAKAELILFTIIFVIIFLFKGCSIII
ncbi:hypothetical protein [Clostridium sp. UBA1056]|uniref:hypothetical protein n=1 Tax=unclassified Clostridium TaxID=2614128 RepID=UPI0032177F01